jgi:NSS family neurotransmitter:Na+ symporter
MQNPETEKWGSRIGFILATTGSAVGLGNIWRFPSMAAENGGGLFVALFLVIAFLIGVPGLMAELALGRHTGRNPIDAFLMIRPRSGWIGALGVLASFLILSYYSVIAGWVLAYVIKAFTGELAGLDAIGLRETFTALSVHPWQPVAWHGAFMVLTATVVIAGIKKGIERWSKILMPGLVLLLLVLAVQVFALEGARAGVTWFLRPHWEEVTWQALLRAMGQVFFSFGLGMGVMITYGSYLHRREDIHKSALYVALADVGIALLAGLIVIPTLFAFGLPIEGGPGLLFVTLPTVLGQMPLGFLLNIIFFVMVAIAALTSAISLLEVVVAFVHQRLGWHRWAATLLAAICIFALGVPSALSQGAYQLEFFGRDFLSAVDALASDVLLPLGGLLTALFVGWVWGIEPALEELRQGAQGFRTARLWALSVRFIIPLMVAVILVAGVLGLR